MHRAFGWRARGSEFGRFGRQAEVVEDPGDGGLIADVRQQAARSAAVGADQGVEQEHALEEFSPEVVPAPTGALSRGVGDMAEVAPGCGALVSGPRRTLWLGGGRRSSDS